MKTTPSVYPGEYRRYGDNRAGMGGLRTTPTQQMHDLFTDSRLSRLESGQGVDVSPGSVESESFYRSHPLGQTLDSLAQTKSLRQWMPQQLSRAYKVATRGESRATSDEESALYNVMRKAASPEFSWSSLFLGASSPNAAQATRKVGGTAVPIAIPDKAFNPANAARGAGAQSLWRNASKPSVLPAPPNDLASVMAMKPHDVLGVPLGQNGEVDPNHPWGRVQRLLNTGKLSAADQRAYADWAKDTHRQLSSRPGFDQHDMNSYLREIHELVDMPWPPTGDNVQQPQSAQPPSVPSQQHGTGLHPLDAVRQLGQQGAGLRSSPLNSQYNALIQQWQGATPRANQQAMAQRMAMQGSAPAAQSQQPQQAPWEPRLAQLAPDNPADAARANQLDAVLLGHDMRFGPKSPASMFRQRVQQQPGMMGGVVHPMMPSFGGAAPRPAPQNNPEASIPTQQAIDEWNANEGKARGRFMEMTPQGISASGQAYQSNPGQYALGLNNLLGRMNKGAAVSQDANGNIVDMAGNPISVEQMRQMSGQVRTALQDQKINGLRQNARIRNAVTDAQRGRPGALVAANAAGLMPGNVLDAMFPQPAPFIQVGPNGRGFNGGGGPIPAPANDQMDRIKMMAPFIQHLPPEAQMRLMMGWMGDAAQNNPVNVRQGLQNVEAATRRAAQADKAVAAPQPGDEMEVPDGVTANQAYAALHKAHPNWSMSRKRGAVAAKYPDFMPAAEQHPVFGGLGKNVNPATGQVERSWYHPSALMDAFQSLQYDGEGEGRKSMTLPLPSKQPKQRTLNPMTW